MIPYQLLIEKAYEAQQRSYSPYSHFMVGAALYGANHIVYQGCNIENAAYSPSNCAERTAFFKAVSEGVTDFLAIAIVGNDQAGKQTDYCFPCGVCRQVMAEFCASDEFEIIVAKSKTEYKVYTLKELLPGQFSLDHN